MATTNQDYNNIIVVCAYELHVNDKILFDKATYTIDKIEIANIDHHGLLMRIRNVHQFLDTRELSLLRHQKMEKYVPQEQQLSEEQQEFIAARDRLSTASEQLHPSTSTTATPVHNFIAPFNPFILIELHKNGKITLSNYGECRLPISNYPNISCLLGLHLIIRTLRNIFGDS